jgi:hypothetical protein
MDNNRVSVIWAIVAIVVFLSAFNLGRNTVEPEVVETKLVVYDTITRVEIVHDTMWRDRLVYRDLPVVVKDVDTVRITDTVTVAVPIYNYRFKDDLYDITAEGYDVKLNSVTVYPKTEYKYSTHTVEIRRRWGLGVQAGYGFSKDGLSPFIGIGVSYNILTW